MSGLLFDLPPIGAGQPLWSYLRQAVQVGPFGPNSLSVIEQGGKISLTPAEAEHLAKAAEKWFADRLTHQWVRQCVANAMPLGYTDRDPYSDVNEAATAVLAVIAAEATT